MVLLSRYALLVEVLGYRGQMACERLVAMVLVMLPMQMLPGGISN